MEDQRRKEMKKQLFVNNFFSNDNTNRNVNGSDNRTQLQMEALALNQEILNRHIQGQNSQQRNSMAGANKKRQVSVNPAKQRTMSYQGANVSTSNKANSI